MSDDICSALQRLNEVLLYDSSATITISRAIKHIKRLERDKETLEQKNEARRRHMEELSFDYGLARRTIADLRHKENLRSAAQAETNDRQEYKEAALELYVKRRLVEALDSIKADIEKS